MSKKELVIKTKRQEHSSLSAFIERPVPSEAEVKDYNRAVRREAWDQEIDDNLSEIYRDRHGNLVDVRKMNVKKRRSFGFRLRRLFISLVLLAGLAYGAYYFYNLSQRQAAVVLEIKAPEKVLAGEEFSYEINYLNSSNTTLNRVSLSLKYPDNFIFTESSLPPNSQNSSWLLADIAPGDSATLLVKGRLINKQDSPNIIQASISYVPSGLSTEFKKETSANTIISGLGFNIDITYVNAALIGQDNEAVITISNCDANTSLSSFFLNVTSPNNISLSDVSLNKPANIIQLKQELGGTQSIASTTPVFSISKVSGPQWQLSGLTAGMDAKSINIKYKVNEKLNDSESLLITFGQIAADGRNLVFWEKNLDLQVMKSDLNLSLAVNGQKNDSAVNFGDTLNYVISYSNKGASTLKDINIRAVLKGEFFDFNSLRDDNKGERRDNVLLWTKDQLPALAEISPNQEGQIAFSIRLKDFQPEDLGKDLVLNSQASFNLATSDNSSSSQDRKSNIVLNRLNSNLAFKEEIRYFDDNNIPVGSGPLPPKVGQKTSVRVYWTVNNSLHELNDARVLMTLPDYVAIDENRINVSVGSFKMETNQDNQRQLIWDIGRVPSSVKQLNADFIISLSPQESDRDKIMILSSGSTISALDIETQGEIKLRSDAKTTKLEDDDIAGMNNSGRVE